MIESLLDSSLLDPLNSLLEFLHLNYSRSNYLAFCPPIAVKAKTAMNTAAEKGNDPIVRRRCNDGYHYGCI